MARFASVWLLVTAAACGAVVMAVELLGARMLGVVYGGSLTVWAAMISVTLISLAAGYFAGGHLAERRPQPAILYSLLLADGLLLVACQYAGRVVEVCYRAFGLELGALASSAAIFFLPLALFGVVSPFVIRLLCERNGRVGVTSGTVYAVSTVGSVVGTLLAGLWIIPSFGTAAGLRFCAVIVAAVGVVGLVGARGWKAAATAALPAFLALLPGAASRVGAVLNAPDGERVELVAVRESAHGHMTVLDKGRYRLLVVNGIVQTGIPRGLRGLARGQGLASGYYQELLPYTLSDPARANALIIGLAGGMTASLLQLHGVAVECVDLDPAIIAVAREYFSFEGAAVAADGRRFLEDCTARYDFCVMDTYSGDVFPFHLATREAFEAAKRVLKPGGVLALNYIGAPKGKAFACLHLTIARVFRHVLAIGGEPGDDVQTITVFASERAIEFNKGWLDDQGSAGGADPVSEAIERLTVRPDPTGAFVLTDDRNPIDLLRAGEARRWRARTIANIGAAAGL